MTYKGEHAKVSSLFYNIGKMVGPRVRKVKWIWQSITASEADTIKAEHEVGQDLAREIRNRLELDIEPQAGQMLNKVGRHLAACVANKLRTFSFEVIKGTEPNAFALPGGFIFVTRSLLELCDWNQDEIAFILGHEMGHVIRGHAMDRIISNSAISFGATAIAVRGALASWVGRVGVKFLESAYSQDLELEADRLGVRLVGAAGYDSGGPERLLLRLSELKRSAKGFELGNYFSTHPSFDVRIDNATL
jgi:predicted Zn-dependent protease